MTAEHLKELYDEVARCNRCGFCQSACPVRRVTGDEMNVARGRIAFVRATIEDKLPLGFKAREVLYDCLLCKACVANCFPKVPTPEIVVSARSALFNRYAPKHLVRYAARELLTDQDRLGRLTRLIRSGARAGVSGLLSALRLMRLGGGAAETADELARELPERSFREDPAAVPTRMEDASRPLANYFVGCAINAAFPQTANATIRVLTGLGFRVRVLSNACCGMPVYALGDLDDARMLARENLERLGKHDGPVVTDCSTCASFLKDYPKLFEEGAEDRVRAVAFATRVRDVVELLPPGMLARRATETFTFHDPCHLSRYQELSGRVREVLKGGRFVEMAEADWCCGGAGTYNVTHSRLSGGILERKMSNVRRTGVAMLLTSCPACMLQLRLGTRRAGLPVRVVHLTELLAEHADAD